MNKEHKAFLDNLRDSGEVNMFGAAEYIEDEFLVSKQEARSILKEWMSSFK